VTREGFAIPRGPPVIARRPLVTPRHPPCDPETPTPSSQGTHSVIPSEARDLRPDVAPERNSGLPCLRRRGNWCAPRPQRADGVVRPYRTAARQFVTCHASRVTNRRAHASAIRQVRGSRCNRPRIPEYLTGGSGRASVLTVVFDSCVPTHAGSCRHDRFAFTVGNGG
jgi:hypothetical protein